jgi:hypothetical protein
MAKFSSKIAELFVAYDDGTMDKYYRTLGTFVTLYSEIEARLQEALAHLAGVTSPTSKAVFNGVRTDAALGYITRIAEAQEWPTQRRKEFEAFRPQVDAINKLRNGILHYGAVWAGNKTWTVSNEKFIHAPKKLREFPISIPILEDAIADIGKIQSHLMLFLWSDVMPDDAREDHVRETEKPWRYRPPAQGRKANKNPKNSS